MDKYIKHIEEEMMRKFGDKSKSTYNMDVDVPLWLAEEMCNLHDFSLGDKILFPSVKYGVFPLTIIKKQINKYNIENLFDIRDNFRVIINGMVFCGAEDHHIFLINYFNNILMLEHDYKSVKINDFYKDLSFKMSQIIDKFKENEIFIDIVFGDIKNFLEYFLLSLYTKNNRPYRKSFEGEIDEIMISKKYLTWVENCEKEIEKYIETSKTCSKKYGEVFTPQWLIDDMIKLLPKATKDMVFLDPAAGIGNFSVGLIKKLMVDLEDEIIDEEERKKHILENMIVQCELQVKNSFINYYILDPENKYNLKIFTGSFLSEDKKNINPNFLDKCKEWGIKNFSSSLMNPPYTQMIDMRFIQNTYKISDSIVCVHPSTWLLDEKGKQKQFITTKKLIKDDLISIELFNGNGVFGISLFVPCVITYINKNITHNNIKCVDNINGVEIEYNNVNEINKFSNTDIYPRLKNKINQIILSLGSVWSNKYNEGEKYVNMSQIRGHVKDANKLGLDMGSDMLVEDFYTTVTKDELVISKKNKHLYFGFDTNTEGENFLNYLKTNFSRFCLSIYKNNSQLCRGELEIIPWLDFTQEWTDEKLYKEFNITEEEINFINKHIPKYY